VAERPEPRGEVTVDRRAEPRIAASRRQQRDPIRERALREEEARARHGRRRGGAPEVMSAREERHEIGALPLA
jgi:hypothetical protein